ncbi:hypothetical protein RSPO_m00840 (plasmid) [Ralstonia solanacearum Po82]|uniref:Uncharacterized protein n=1 Tax=Ralstonia solanacearum (strain Po82) TaxID=1031711 RepID=F6GA34_RALS8|nr:hypothetical protein RSPO_m00840 [Ralstonia solanacearum Po82]
MALAASNGMVQRRPDHVDIPNQGHPIPRAQTGSGVGVTLAADGEDPAQEQPASLVPPRDGNQRRTRPGTRHLHVTQP